MTILYLYFDINLMEFLKNAEIFFLNEILLNKLIKLKTNKLDNSFKSLLSNISLYRYFNTIAIVTFVLISNRHLRVQLAKNLYNL